MFATLSLGWNIIGGYTGYVSFGNVVFFGVGSYTTAALWQHWPSKTSRSRSRARWRWASRSRRARDSDSAPARALFRHRDARDRARHARDHGEHRLARRRDGFTVRPARCVLDLLLRDVDRLRGEHPSRRFMARSKLGYGLVAIRENEEAAAVLGVNPTRYKVTAWAISAAMAAAAGAVFAGANGFIDAATAFAVDNNVFPIVMAILGGIGTVAGPRGRRVDPDRDQRNVVEPFPAGPYAVLRRRHRDRRDVLAARHPVAVRAPRRLEGLPVFVGAYRV